MLQAELLCGERAIIAERVTRIPPVRGGAQEDGEEDDGEEQQEQVDAAVHFGGVGIDFWRHFSGIKLI